MSRNAEYVERRRAALELAEDEERWQAIRNGNTGERDEMITVHAYLLEAVAVTLAKNLPEHIDVEDLKSYGALGLLRAVDTYDPEKGAFSTHAVIAIRGKILDELRAIDWAPKSLRRKARDLEKATALLRRKWNREPDDYELAEHLETSVEAINHTRLSVRHSTHKSMSDYHPHNEVRREEDVAEQKAGPEESALIRLCQSELVSWYRELTVEEKVIIGLYYYRDYNLSQIARETGWSEAKVVSTHTRLVTEFRARLLDILREGGLDGVSDSGSD